MTKGAAAAASPSEVAKVILKAAKDRTDRLRYTATDAVAALKAHSVLPESAWRKMMAKSFGLGASR